MEASHDTFPDGKPRLPEAKCPECGSVHDTATPLEGESRRPKPGSISLCIHCGLVSLFGEDLSRRPLTPDEVVEMARDRELTCYLRRVVSAIHFLRGQRN